MGDREILEVTRRESPVNMDNGSSEARKSPPHAPAKKKSRSSRDAAAIKRRCVSTACIACRRRKSKCDGNTPSCAACSSVYGTECVYDPNSDHRRKGVYKEKADTLKARESTLQTIVQAILNSSEDSVSALVRQIRNCDNLDDVADTITRKESSDAKAEDEDDDDYMIGAYSQTVAPTFENELSGKMGELRIENGSVRFIGGTSNLIYLTPEDDDKDGSDTLQQQEEPVASWTTVTADTELILHLLNMYLSWHYPYFTTFSKSLFLRDFLLGKPPGNPKRTLYCSSLLVNAMLALGCHFTNSPAGCADPEDPATKGDAFFQEAKRLFVENDEYEKPRLTTVQALALMSLREAGCGREAKGWVYSGMSFRMALDMGLNLDSGGMASKKEPMDEKEIDARRVTFWGCYLFDKCWSNYLGRMPQLPTSNITVPKYDVFPDEDSDIWSPYTDTGVSQLNSQPSRTRAVALQISALCEISSDLLIFFYHPQTLERSMGKQAELKKLSELHTRLEAWRKDLPKEFEAKEGQLPNVLLMHMFFHLLYIHLFRPFLKYNPSTSPLPSHVSPRKFCTSAASAISKLMRLYKRVYGLRQICNIAVYIVHSACTIHLLNLPDKAAKRDIVHGTKHLEEIAEDWLCARRTLSIISVLARKWKIELPDEARDVLLRTDAKYGTFSPTDVPSPKSDTSHHPSPSNLGTPPGYSSPEASKPSQVIAPPPNPPGTAQNNVYTTLAPFVPVSAGGEEVGAQIPMSLADDSGLNMTAPYLRSATTGLYNVLPPVLGSSPRTTVPGQTTQQPAMAGPSQARQVSPTTIFGGTGALAESQNWWLRDPVNLAAGFDNWEELGSVPGESAFFMGDASGLDDSPRMGGAGSQEDWYN
ncbi:hypothetical protein V495_04943 [Pseudogymnoascus sp. VKM F-4514 (FW-929)]|nr:hypothetical protein V495_04943 [Pseudogymnoascus sp. VKM F-4514 (FW-929)]KFY57917.1 hypothetical protein V497_05174 [Pseudogymnoascus sp. VKM F-4516 (FW-969)]